MCLHLGSESEAWKSTARGCHEALQPVNSFAAEIEHFMAVHPGIRTECLRPCPSWTAIKKSLSEGKIDERVDNLARTCFQTNAACKVKDRYCLD